MREDKKRIDTDTGERIQNGRGIAVRWYALAETSADDNDVHWFKMYHVVAFKARKCRSYDGLCWNVCPWIMVVKHFMLFL